MTAENRAFRESNAPRYIMYALVVIAIAAVAYIFRAVTFDAYVALVGVALAIAFLAASEARFQEVKNELKDIKRTLEEMKDKK